jgi:ubiquinone/menaquinone biosynthesis C-methylase UbiE
MSMHGEVPLTTGADAGGETRADYRNSHATTGAVTDYIRTHEVGYYAALWRKIEKPLVQATLREQGGPQKKCLDFACGTGRITAIAADHFAEVVGVDVSALMLASAHRADNVRLHQIDITRQSLGKTFDVVTAFRFFLNAEQQLRQEALEAIRKHLKRDGRLVCNIQMNATSPIGVASRIANQIPFSRMRNTMSSAEFSALLKSSGFTVERVTAYGYLPRPGRLLPQLCEASIEPAERVARALRIPSRFAQQLLFVAKRG